MENQNLPQRSAEGTPSASNEEQELVLTEHTVDSPNLSAKKKKRGSHSHSHSHTHSHRKGRLKRRYRRLLRNAHMKSWQPPLILALFAITLALLILCRDRGELHLHAYGEWEVISSPTCTEKGIQQRYCACGATEIESLPTVHSFVFAGIRPDNTAFENSALVRCRSCGEEGYAAITPEQIGLPIVRIEPEGRSAELYADEALSVKICYQDPDRQIESAGKITLKDSGNSSKKKSYLFSFQTDDGTDRPTRLLDRWGEQSLYALNADRLDSSLTRDLVASTLFGEIAATRRKVDHYTSLPAGGASDGYPVALYWDGKFQGCYTLAIPLDGWMFGMQPSSGETDSTDRKEAILYAEKDTLSTALRSPMEAQMASYGWKTVFCSTGNDTEWVKDSFNRLIRFLNESDDERFRAEIENYIPVDRTIDTMLLTLFVGGIYNQSQRLVWSSYDGRHWTCTPYDLDATFGLSVKGHLYTADTVKQMLDPSHSSSDCNLLWKRLWNCYAREIAARYQELRAELLTASHIDSLFTSVYNRVPTELRSASRIRFPDELCPESASLETIHTFTVDRIAQMDALFQKTVQQPVS